MSVTYKLDPEGDRELLSALAAGFADFGDAAAESVRAVAPKNTGRYANSIQATTFLNGAIVRGESVRGTGVQSKAQIWTVIYTTNKLGHLLELGTGPRDVVVKKAKVMSWPPDKYGSGGVAMKVHQPGMARRPHFWPGFAAVIPRAGALIGHGATVRARVNTRVL